MVSVVIDNDFHEDYNKIRNGLLYVNVIYGIGKGKTKGHLIKMRKKIYCSSNFYYLCKEKGLKKHELLNQVGLSDDDLYYALKGFKKHADRISKICKVFDCNEYDFAYKNLKLPSQLQYLSDLNELEKYIDDIWENINPSEWEMFYDQSVELYKHIKMKKALDVGFLVLSVNTSCEEESDGIIPRWMSASAYILFNNEHIWLDSEFESQYKEIAEIILRDKGVAYEDWYEQKQYIRQDEPIRKVMNFGISDEQIENAFLRVIRELVTDISTEEEWQEFENQIKKSNYFDNGQNDKK